MFLNREEIANLAWLDSVCFAKEDLLLVQDLTRPGSVHFEERLCRLRGNLLFILSIESSLSVSHLTPSNKIVNKSDFESFSSLAESHLPDAALARNNALLANYCDELSSDDIHNLNRLGRLTELFSQVADKTVGHLLDTNINKPETVQPKHPVAKREILYVLLLEECGIRANEDPSKHEFSIHFADPLQSAVNANHSPCRSLRISCHSETQCDDWLTAIRCCSYTHLKSLQRAIQRRIQFAQRVQQRLLRNSEPIVEDQCDELVEEGTIVDESWLPEDSESESDDLDSESNKEIQGHQQRLKRRGEPVLQRPVSCSPPPQSCSSHIDLTTDELGIHRPLGRWITNPIVNSTQSKDLEQVLSAVPCTVQADIGLYFRQGQLPCLQAQLTCFTVVLHNQESAIKTISSKDFVKCAPFWQENTETQHSLQPRFAKKFHIPNSINGRAQSNRLFENSVRLNRVFDQLSHSSTSSHLINSEDTKDKIWLRVQIFDVIEQLTQTRVLLGQCEQPLPVQWFKCNITTEATDESSNFLRMHLRSPLPGDQIIGSVCVQRCFDPLPQLLLSGAGAGVISTELTENSLDCFVEQKNDQKSVFKMGSEARKSSISSSSNGMLETSATIPSPLAADSHLFVNTIFRSFQFELPVSDTAARKLTITELMSEPVLALQLPQTIMNFFMEDEKRLMNCTTYSLGEVKPSFQRRQMQVLESHLRLVNLVTESINQLSQEQLNGRCFRPSSQKLPLHLQFVPINLHLQRSIFSNPNVTTDPLSATLQRLQLSDQQEDSESDSISCVLNVYTHGAFCVHALGLDQGLDRTFRELCGKPRQLLQPNHRAQFFHQHSNSSSTPGLTLIGQAWFSMETYFRVTHLAQQVSRLTSEMLSLLQQLQQAQKLLGECSQSDFVNYNEEKVDSDSKATVIYPNKDDNFSTTTGLSLLQFNQLQQRFSVQQQAIQTHQQHLKTVLLSTFSKLEYRCQQIASILDADQCEQTLSRLDTLRSTTVSGHYNSGMDNVSNRSGIHADDSATSNSNSSLNKLGAIERTISCPINQLQNSAEALHQTQQKLNELRRYSSSQRIEEQNEFEPVDLTQLNIRASVISMQSKLNQLSKLQTTKNISNSDTQSSEGQHQNNGSVLCARLHDDLQPCVRKLGNSVQSLQRTAAVCYALQALQMTREQLEQFYLLRLRRDALFSQALTTLVIAVLGELTTGHGSSLTLLQRLFEQRALLCVFEGLLSCYAEEIPMLQDMQFALTELSQCVRLRFINAARENTIEAQFAGQSVHGSFQGQSHARSGSFAPLSANNQFAAPRLEGNGFNMHVVIPFNDAQLPDSFECEIVPLFFNIGVNENATLAETFGQVRLQEEINRTSFLRLEQFVATKANIESCHLVDRLTALRSELYASRAKNVRILQLVEQISYDLHAIRFTNCKSGKDRTAMGVTLEQVRRAAHLYSFTELQQPKLFQQMLDTLRSEGTRRENTRKNVGVAKYAFNSLRVMTFPKFYRPPPGTYGYNVQT